MKNKQHLNLAAVAIILMAGLVIRIIIAIYSSLSLDQQFSLYYADFYSYKELLFVFQSDIHPGGYYALLKLFLLITRNKSALTFFSSILPEMFGVIFYLWHSWKEKRSTSFLLIFTMIMMLNPFLAQITSQIRMYGLVIFFALTSSIFFERWWKNYRPVNFILFCILLFLGIYTSYSFLFLAIGYISYIILDKGLLQRRKVWYSIILSLLCVSGFLLARGASTGSQFQEQFNYASWIPMPTFNNVVSVIITSLGVLTDIHSQESNGIAVALFLTLVVAMVMILRKQQFPDNFTPPIRQFLCFFLIPFSFIVFLSFTLPLLTRLPFFYKYSPHVSLILPRVFLPITLVTFTVLSKVVSLSLDYLKNTLSQFVFTTIFFALILVWANSYDSFITKVWKEKNSNTFLVEKIDQSNILVWPDYSWYTTISTKDINSEQINFNLSHKVIDPYNTTFAAENKCTGLNGKNIYVLRESSQTKDHQAVLTKLNECCSMKNFNKDYLVANCP